MLDQSFVTDHPSNRESVRPTVRLVLLRRKANIVLSGTTSTLFIATTKVAAFGRHHQRGGAAFGRATSVAVSFVVAMNRVDVVALNTTFALRLSKTRRTVGRTDSRLDGWSVTKDGPGKSDCIARHFQDKRRVRPGTLHERRTVGLSNSKQRLKTKSSPRVPG